MNDVLDVFKDLVATQSVFDHARTQHLNEACLVGVGTTRYGALLYRAD